MGRPSGTEAASMMEGICGGLKTGAFHQAACGVLAAEYSLYHVSAAALPLAAGGQQGQAFISLFLISLPRLP